MKPKNYMWMLLLDFQIYLKHGPKKIIAFSLYLVCLKFFFRSLIIISQTKIQIGIAVPQIFISTALL